jgi:outer membrane protein insertion porin family
MPGMKNDRSVRPSIFLDAGSVWGPDGVIPQQEGLRYSAGIAVMWVSPMGPLKVSIAQPLNSHPGDNLQRFQFQFGQQF